MFAKYVGISKDTAALIEHFRESSTESEDEIIWKGFTKLKEMDRVWQGKIDGQSDSEDIGNRQIGCDLGKGVVLQDGEKIFCFRYKASLRAREPEGVGVARDGKLIVEGQEVRPSKGSWVQPALEIVQRKINDVDSVTGKFTSLNAWEYWYVDRGGQLSKLGRLRDPERITKRNRHLKTGAHKPTPLSDF